MIRFLIFYMCGNLITLTFETRSNFIVLNAKLKHLFYLNRISTTDSFDKEEQRFSYKIHSSIFRSLLVRKIQLLYSIILDLLYC